LKIIPKKDFSHSAIWWYYLIVFIFGIFPDILVESPWFITLFGVNIGIGDMLTFVILTVFGISLYSSSGRGLFKQEKLYCILLACIGVSFAYGLTKYSYRAIGELRYHIHFFTIGIPFYLYIRYELNKTTIIEIIEQTLKILAWISVLSFFIRPFFGIDDYDFRGPKALGSHQSFYIGAYIMWLIAKTINKDKVDNYHGLQLAFLSLILILSKNRTAVAAVLLGLAGIFIFKIRLKIVIYCAACFFVGAVMLHTINSSVVANLSETYASMVNPVEDANARWRILIQGEALEQAMETFWLGQGLGGYFYFEIPNLPPIEEYPHSQYILLFLKCGIISAVCALSFLIGSIVRYFKSTIKNEDIKRSSALLTLTMIMLSQIVYGFGYVFIPIVGLLYGLQYIMFITTTATPKLICSLPTNNII
jgi:hypothetical protein